MHWWGPEKNIGSSAFVSTLYLWLESTKLWQNLNTRYFSYFLSFYLMQSGFYWASSFWYSKVSAIIRQQNWSPLATIWDHKTNEQSVVRMYRAILMLSHNSVDTLLLIWTHCIVNAHTTNVSLCNWAVATRSWQPLCSIMSTYLYLLFYKSEEHCSSETFHLHCPLSGDFAGTGSYGSAGHDRDVEPGSSQVIVVRRADYGRMRPARRCISSAYTESMGCRADVAGHLHSVCTGRSNCSLLVATMDSVSQPCPKDFKSYVEIVYECLAGKCAECMRSDWWLTMHLANNGR